MIPIAVAGHGLATAGALILDLAIASSQSTTTSCEYLTGATCGDGRTAYSAVDVVAQCQIFNSLAIQNQLAGFGLTNVELFHRPVTSVRLSDSAALCGLSKGRLANSSKAGTCQPNEVVFLDDF